MNTGERNRHGRIIYQGRSGGRYVVTASGRKQYITTTTTVSTSPPIPDGFKKVTVNGQKWMVSRQGQIRRLNGTRVPLQSSQVNKILTRVVQNHRGHLDSEHIPYVTRNTNNVPNDPNYIQTDEVVSSSTRPNYQPRIYFHRTTGNLYYRTVNGIFRRADSDTVPHHIRVFPRARNQILTFLSMFHNRYPNVAGPIMNGPRTNAQLLNNMSQQIFARGPINVARYTTNEKNRLAPLLLARVRQSKEKYKANKAAGVNVAIYGQYANQAKAYFRGYRAVKPLTGKMSSPRVINATPNRGTPASRNVKNFVSYDNLVTPHIVVKRKGAETFHINPDTLIGFIKSGSGANVAEANLRDWLRQMRRNHPSEPLFQHPASKSKTVRPKNIRFTRT